MFDLIKNMSKSPAFNIILNSERLEAFLLRSGTKQEWLFSPLLFNIILEILVNTMREIGNKMYTD